GPELLFGGFQPAALDRVGRWGGGFLAAAAPSWAGGLFDTVRKSWTDHGRSGAPRIVAQVNVALGSDALVEDARASMGAYYEFSGRADYMVDDAWGAGAAVIGPGLADGVEESTRPG